VTSHSYEARQNSTLRNFVLPGVMVIVDCNYPAPKVNAKISDGQNKRKCIFLNGRI